MIVEGKFIKRISDDIKERKRKFIWDEKWNKLTNIHDKDQEEFKKFVEDKFFNGTQFRYTEIDQAYAKVYNKYKYEEGMWRLFDEFKQDLKNKKNEEAELRNALQNLYDSLIKDFNKNPYEDKLSGEKCAGTRIIYEFENGEKAIFTDNHDKSMDVNFTQSGKKYQISITGNGFRLKFISLLNEMQKKSISRKYKKSKTEDKSTKTSTATKEPQTFDQNKKRRYDLLKDTLKGYELQLKREIGEGKDTTQTKNEINNIKDKIKLMNQTHHFEHLHNFINFKKII